MSAPRIGVSAVVWTWDGAERTLEFDAGPRGQPPPASLLPIIPRDDPRLHFIRRQHIDQPQHLV